MTAETEKQEQPHPHVHKHFHVDIEEILEEVKHLHFPHRYILVFLGFFAFVNLYALRVCLSYAIQPMSIEFEWKSSVKGFALSSFFLGYIVTQVPGGWMASRYGGKWVLGIGILTAAILTIITPECVRSGGIGALIALRILEGIGEGVAFPAMHSLFSLWAPPSERSRMTSIVYSGAYAGTIIVYAISGKLVEDHVMGGWPSIFYIFGILGVVWFVLWIAMARDSPWKDKGISIQERNYIVGTAHPHNEVLPVPWKILFTSKSVWAVIIMNFSHNWAFYTLLTWLPTYFKQQLLLDPVKTSLYSMFPYIAYFIVMNLAALLADKLIRKKVSITIVRKAMQLIAYLISMSLLVALGYIDTVDAAVTMMTFSVGGMAFAGSGFNCNHLDIAPQYAGILMGLSNFAGTIPGIISPTLTGVILGDTPEIQHWRTVFYICFAIYSFGIIIWLLFASGERIKFPNHPDEPAPATTESKHVELDDKPNTSENASTV